MLYQIVVDVDKDRKRDCVSVSGVRAPDKSGGRSPSGTPGLCQTNPDLCPPSNDYTASKALSQRIKNIYINFKSLGRGPKKRHYLGKIPNMGGGLS